MSLPIYNIKIRCPAIFDFYFKGTIYHQTHAHCKCFLGNLLVINVFYTDKLIWQYCLFILMYLWICKDSSDNKDKEIMTRKPPDGEIYFVVIPYSKIWAESNPNFKMRNTLYNFFNCQNLTDLEIAKLSKDS